MLPFALPSHPCLFVCVLIPLNVLDGKHILSLQQRKEEWSLLPMRAQGNILDFFTTFMFLLHACECVALLLYSWKRRDIVCWTAWHCSFLCNACYFRKAFSLVTEPYTVVKYSSMHVCTLKCMFVLINMVLIIRHSVSRVWDRLYILFPFSISCVY